jgi:acyl-CoA thioesterase-2
LIAVVGEGAQAQRSLRKLLELELVGDHVYRSTFLYEDPYTLFGGQFIAQALRAAGLSVAPDRTPHSLHAYFLRPGDPATPIDFEVILDRDGRSFSARRVIARQGGKVSFTMSASFAIEKEVPPAQVMSMPVVASPDEAESLVMPRLFSYEGRRVEQIFPHHEINLRFWARCTEEMGTDRLLHACAVAYLSDISTGLAALDTSTHQSAASLDHSVWFHQPVVANEWHLVDLTPQVVARGRGWYTGSLFDEKGDLVASVAQEALYGSFVGPYYRFGP